MSDEVRNFDAREIERLEELVSRCKRVSLWLKAWAVILVALAVPVALAQSDASLVLPSFWMSIVAWIFDGFMLQKRFEFL